MISRLDMHEQVLSLTTIGTPHRGTAFADWSLRRFGRAGKPVLNFLRIPTDAWDDLTTERCAIQRIDAKRSGRALLFRGRIVSAETAVAILVAGGRGCRRSGGAKRRHRVDPIGKLWRRL